MEFAVWIFKHADAAPLQAAAPPLLRGLLHLLDDGTYHSLCHPPQLVIYMPDIEILRRLMDCKGVILLPGVGAIGERHDAGHVC